MTTIKALAVAVAGQSSHISIRAFSNTEVLTSLRNESGNLELISWHTPPAGDIVLGADSRHQAGEAQEVALALFGRRAVTAVRSGSGRLLFISWDVPFGLNSITRLADSGDRAGHASYISIARINDSRLVTAVQNLAGNLLLISWELNPDGTFTRLGDSGSKAGGVDRVLIVAMGLDNSTLVTAVRNSSGDLELISWSLSADGTQIQRQPGSAIAGSVGEIATTLVGATDNGISQLGVVTAVQDGAGDILLIHWRVLNGGIERVVDSHNQPAGTASHIAISPVGVPPHLRGHDATRKR